MTGALAGDDWYVGMVIAAPLSLVSPESPESLTACHPATESTSHVIGAPYSEAVMTSFSTTDPVYACCSEAEVLNQAVNEDGADVPTAAELFDVPRAR